MSDIDKINYITTDGWWDTDRTILPFLTKKYKINLFCYDTPLGPYKYPLKDNCGCYMFIVERQKYRAKHPFFIMYSFRQLLKLIRFAYKRDSVNFVLPTSNVLLNYFIACFFPKSRTIFCFHNYKDHIGKKKWLPELVKRIILKKFKYFHFYSKIQCDLHKSEYPDKVSFFTNMPLKDFGVPDSLKTKSESISFLFFGAIEKYKRLDLFIQAANKLDDYENIEFIIAGKCNNNWDHYDRQILNHKKFKLNIRFIQDNEVSEYFAMASFLVLPYSDNTQSGPSLIAINYGLPIIASDLDSFKTIIADGKNGFIFEHDNLSSLVSVMKKAISLSYDEYAIMRKEQIAFKREYSAQSRPDDVLGKFIYNNF